MHGQLRDTHCLQHRRCHPCTNQSLHSSEISWTVLNSDRERAYRRLQSRQEPSFLLFLNRRARADVPALLQMGLGWSRKSRRIGLEDQIFGHWWWGLWESLCCRESLHRCLRYMFEAWKALLYQSWHLTHVSQLRGVELSLVIQEYNCSKGRTKENLYEKEFEKTSILKSERLECLFVMRPDHNFVLFHGDTLQIWELYSRLG